MKLSAPVYHLKRRARLLARHHKIPLHAALDRIAREEGFPSWSLLCAQTTGTSGESNILSRLGDGDILLLGARPGQGKTLLGLKLLLDAVNDGRRAVFFTLEYTGTETRQRIRSLEGGKPGLGEAVEIIADDDICGSSIIHHLAGAPRGTVAVIDYLQLLDQRRDKPNLADQVEALRDFAENAGIILVFLSQIDRSFDPQNKPLPDLQDIRLPNPVDIALFSKTCFLHQGKAQFQSCA